MLNLISARVGKRKALFFTLLITLSLFSWGCSGSSNSDTDNSDSNNTSTPENTTVTTDNARYLGINLFVSQTDYAQDRMFVDVMKMARDWFTIDSDFTVQAPVDSQGWPTTDAKIIMWAGIDNMHGTYYLEGDANAAPTINIGYTNAATISQFSYDATNQKFSALLQFTDAAESALNLQFTNTNGGVRNLKLIRPSVPGSEEPYSSEETFTTEVKALVDKFNLVRFMWSVDGWNGPWQVDWSDRVDPDYCSFSRNSGATINDTNINWAGTGMAWEYAIQFANETGKDVWINMPVGASDDYIRQLAQLWKDNYTVSDGKIYWEYSNEATWDMTGQIQTYLLNLALAAADAGDPVGYDGDSDLNVLKNRYYAQRSMQMSKIWREVWGDDAMMTRIRPVHGGFTSNEIQLTAGLAFLHDYYNNAAGAYVTDPHPVNYYFYGTGAHYYVGDDPDVDNSTNLTRGTMDKIPGDGYSEIENEEAFVEYEGCLAKMYGLKRLAYEGGVWTDNEDYLLPRITEAMIRYQQLWDKYDSGCLTYYVTTGGEDNGTALGFTMSALDLDTPKFRALDQLISTPKTTVTAGKLAPCQIHGADYSVKGPWDIPEPAGLETTGTNQLNAPYHRSSGYIFRTDSSRDYTISLNGVFNNADLEIMIDGVVIVRELVSSNPTYTLSLEPGLHGMRISNYNTDYGQLDTIDIQ